jgi:hypothetical protein
MPRNPVLGGVSRNATRSLGSLLSVAVLALIALLFWAGVFWAGKLLLTRIWG